MKQFTFAKLTDEVTLLEKKNRETSYKAALEGICLLKNEGVLPLKSKKIACYGEGVVHTVKGGTGSGEVNERYAVSIYDGLKNAGFDITSQKWLDEYETVYQKGLYDFYHGSLNLFKIMDFFNGYFMIPFGREISDEDIKLSNCDTAMYVVARQAGEGNDKKLDKGEFNLSKSEVASIKKMAASYKNSILVINSGSYMDISDVVDDVKSIIFYVQQGEEGGNAFADLISGKVSFSAKLTDSWAKTYDDLVAGKTYSYLSGDTKNEDYIEGIYVGYRYFDTFNVKPRFAFGYGLTYTTFDINAKDLTINKNDCEVSIIVKNTGSFTAKEVVQVYAACLNGKLLKEAKRLIGFKKTKELSPNEEETLNIKFNLYDLASYDEETASYILEKGNYIIKVGNASDNVKSSFVLKLDKTISLVKLTNICKIDKELKEIVPPVNKEEDITGLKEIILDSSKIECIKVTYPESEEDKSQDVQDILNKLSVKEMINVCVGEGVTGMYSTEKFYSPGTVGRTTSKLFDKGLINVNLSDGPAGLRLLRVSAINKKGKQRLVEGNYQMAAMNRISTKILKPVLAKETDTKLYQNLTSIPVATALAQSWNEDLLVDIGRLISSEMTEYGITYWLAPALNIHRNPLCGRNFEYFSEDPFVSGKVTAALTKGVQETKGNYVTIKHFCCNNQEDNRTHSNSHIHERALREIYIKGFEIAVKESNPKSVMTSYNLVNGVYTPDRYDLNTKALRNEWGFNGVVMTDWLSTNNGQGTNPEALESGNDMIMPGGKKFEKSLYHGYKTHKLSLKSLRIATSHIIESIIHAKVCEKIKTTDFE